MRLEAIHLAFHPFPSLSKATQEWWGRAHPSDCCTSPLIHFPHPYFLLSFQFLIFHFSPSLVLFRVIAPSVATSASAFLRGLYFAPSCSEAILPLLSGAFSIAVFHPFFLPLWLSRTHSWRILIFTNSAGTSGQYDQISVGQWKRVNKTVIKEKS